MQTTFPLKRYKVIEKAIKSIPLDELSVDALSNYPDIPLEQVKELGFLRFLIKNYDTNLIIKLFSLYEGQDLIHLFYDYRLGYTSYAEGVTKGILFIGRFSGRNSLTFVLAYRKLVEAMDRYYIKLLLNRSGLLLNIKRLKGARERQYCYHLLSKNKELFPANLHKKIGGKKTLHIYLKITESTPAELLAKNPSDKIKLLCLEMIS